MERLCETCPMRAGCVTICPEVEAQLPSPNSGADRFTRSESDEGTYLEFLAQEDHIESMRALAYCLNPTQREAFDAYYQEGLSHVAIGERLGISSSAVAKRLVSAREHIIREAFLRVERSKEGKP